VNAKSVSDIKENIKMYYHQEENEFKKGAKYLVKDRRISQDRISELTILEITKKAIKVKWDNGGVEWYLKSNFP
jgi:hypothetical protein